jgi:hypothetical protein
VPDLLINFRVINKPATGQTYSEYDSNYFTISDVSSLQDIEQATFDTESLMWLTEKRG